MVFDPVRLPLPSATALADGRIHAEIIHVDRFGNCVTSVRGSDVPTDSKSTIRIRIGTTSISDLMPYYAAAPDDAPFAIWGSAGFLEIAVKGGSAAKRLGIRTGQPLTLET